MTWLRLSEATVLIDHDVQKARERLQRAIKKSWLVQPPGLSQATLDPNVPLRIQLTSLPGLRIEGRAWLDNPVLHWEASEIECLCKPWTPSSQALSSVATQSRVKIEIWGEDLVRLWGRDNSASPAWGIDLNPERLNDPAENYRKENGASATRDELPSTYGAHANRSFDGGLTAYTHGCRTK